MSVYPFKITATATNIDVELDANQRAQFVKPPNKEISAATGENRAMTEFHYGDKLTSIRTHGNAMNPVTVEAYLFVESAEREITIYISGNTTDIIVSSMPGGDTKAAATTVRSPYNFKLGNPI